MRHGYLDVSDHEGEHEDDTANLMTRHYSLTPAGNSGSSTRTTSRASTPGPRTSSDQLTNPNVIVTASVAPGRTPSSTLPHDSHIAPASVDESYRLRRYPGRGLLNILGPTFVLGFYMYIVFEYLLRPQSNGVIASRLIPGKGIFFAWLILSIFLLDWAKSGVAGFEAYGLMQPRLAPSTAMQLMWHGDRAWGQLSGWWKAGKHAIKYVAERLDRKKRRESAWDGPGILWYYLAFSSLLFYIAIPLSGLSMDPALVLRRNDGLVVVIGPNQTNFGVQPNAQIAEMANGNWRAGSLTTPQSPAVFYAPQEVRNASSLFYDDTIQALYTADLANISSSPTQRNITIFSGPFVAERAYGRSWGLKVSVSCQPRNIYTGLNLIDVSNFTDWAMSGLNSQTFNASTSYGGYGISNATYFSDAAYGIDFVYMLATDRDPSGWFDYTNYTSAKGPLVGSFEMALWQGLAAGIPAGTAQDDTRQLAAHPIVEFSDSHYGYGVHCDVVSDTGFAILDPGTNTFSNFEHYPTEYSTSFDLPIFEYSGAMAIETVVWTALSKVTAGWLGPPSCLPAENTGGGIESCSAFYGANVATGGQPVQLPDTHSLRQAMIGPERLTLAMYKLFGHAAASMMAVSPSNWTSPELQGLTETSDIEPGVVPWQLVLALLALWWLVTVPPQCWAFFDRRWSSALEAKDMFRFGAQNPDVGGKMANGEFTESDVLRDIPGMIGDLSPEQKLTGRLGLSSYRARSEKQYSWK
jgi:hypothetical protein